MNWLWSKTSERHLADGILIFLVIVFVPLSFMASIHESATIDEFRHLSTGVYYWQSGDYSFDIATPPLWKMIMALPAYLAGANAVRFAPLPEIAAGWEPWFVATDFMRDNAGTYTGYLQSARLINVLAAALCLALFYRRCRRDSGPVAALLSAAFLAFSPTFLAHSHYGTTDIIATLTIMAAVFILIDYLRAPHAVRLIGAVLIFSLSLLCKFTALLLLPLLLIVPLLVVWRCRGDNSLSRLVVLLLKPLTLVVIVPLLTVNLFYGFNDTGTALSDMFLESRSLSALKQSAVGKLPIPLPRLFIESFDRQKSDSDYSEFPAYFMGKWSGDGFRSYYLAAFCMKESVPFLLILLATPLALRRKGEGASGRDELFILAYIPVVLLFVLSFGNKLNVGVRYLLPAYPFLCYGIARLYASFKELPHVRLLMLLLLMLHLVSVFRVSPYFMSYFNEVVGGPGKGFHYLLDSNIDLGQDLPALRRYMTANGIPRVQLAYFGNALPEFYGITYEPLTVPTKPGYVAISVSLLQGHPYLLTYEKPPRIIQGDPFRQFRGMRPVGRAGYSMLIYRFD